MSLQGLCFHVRTTYDVPTCVQLAQRAASPSPCWSEVSFVGGMRRQCGDSAAAVRRQCGGSAAAVRRRWHTVRRHSEISAQIFFHSTIIAICTPEGVLTHCSKLKMNGKKQRQFQFYFTRLLGTSSMSKQ